MNDEAPKCTCIRDESLKKHVRRVPGENRSGKLEPLLVKQGG